MENLKLFIGSRNTHRINTMMVDLFIQALKDIQLELTNLGLPYFTFTTATNKLEDVNAAIIFNGESKDDKLIDLLASKEIPIFYMYDDVDIEVPTKVNYLVSQFEGYKSDLLHRAAGLGMVAIQGS